MSRVRFNPVWAKTVMGALLALAVGAGACDEDGKTTPEKCLDPVLPLYDIQDAGGPSITNPCITPVGHSVSFIGNPETAGTSSGGTTSSGGKAGGAGKSSLVDGGAGGADAADAGAGGA